MKTDIGLLLKSIVNVHNSYINPTHGIQYTEPHVSHNTQFTFNSEIISYKNIYNYALMSYNAYTTTEKSDWYSVPYEVSKNIGVNPDSIKGYVFSDKSLKTHVVAIKGTSINWFDSSSFTPNSYEIQNSVRNDKFNDNLFLSCCYYKQSNIFKGNYSCDIKSDEHVCAKECFIKSKEFDINYLNIIDQIGLNLENELDFEKDNIVFTGHSLGAILATYLGIKYNKPVIGFEAPGGKHYFDLIGLDYTNSKNIYHFGHNADSIFMGNCDSRSSPCYIGGYIIRTKCHVGNTCIYDAVGKLGMKESILNHRLKFVIDNVLPHWENDGEFPECKVIDNCIDCEQWTYI
jgi:lipase ATG15